MLKHAPLHVHNTTTFSSDDAQLDVAPPRVPPGVGRGASNKTLRSR
jgi:hypothetical protein